MFKRISTTIALQFTAFVFALLLVNGAIFLAADIGNERRMSQGRLQRMGQGVVHEAEEILADRSTSFPRPMRDRVRLLDRRGNTLYASSLFEGASLPRGQGFSHLFLDDEEYAVLSLPVMQSGAVAGYVQIAGMERQGFGQLPLRALLYLLVSFAISALTYVVGVFFARRSLRPAQESMERLEQFTQDASHELRTPLAALNSSLDLALKNKKYQEGIVSAKDDLRHVSVLVERLLELARLDKFVLKTAPVDLGLIVEQSIEKQRECAKGKSLEIRQHIAPGIIVEGDALLLSQVVGNLLANAVKFTHGKDDRIIVRLTKQELSIEDTGIGIRDKDLPHVFDRFFQAEASRSIGGLGLGLALVKRIVELHGWTIGVESTEGKGTIFTIRLRS